MPISAALPASSASGCTSGPWRYLLSSGKIANRALLFSPGGEIEARFDKIHMFDVDLPGGESYRESKNYQAGDVAVLAELPWGTLGVTVCYDLRFPHLYRALAKAGADYLAIPSAFTRPTGAAHWHVLMRARAIENGCFVLAAAQAGRHESGRETYGHSLIVTPWGEVLAEADGVHPTVIVADIDFERGAAGALARALAPARPAVPGRACRGAAGKGSLMIRYRLKCKKGHEFEAWFASSDAFDKQEKRDRCRARTAAPARSRKR